MDIDEQKALVLELKNGNSDAFEKFVLEFSTKIEAIARNIVQDSEAAKDIAQNVFLKVFRKIALFRCESKLSSWVYRITMNETYEYCRTTKKNIFIKFDDHFDVAPRSSCPESALLYYEFNKLLGQSVQKLSEKEMMVFVFHDIEEMSTNEICKVLNGKLPAIKSRLLRSRRKLRKSYIGKYLAP